MFLLGVGIAVCLQLVGNGIRFGGVHVILHRGIDLAYLVKELGHGGALAIHLLDSDFCLLDELRYLYVKNIRHTLLLDFQKKCAAHFKATGVG